MGQLSLNYAPRDGGSALREPPRDAAQPLLRTSHR